MTIKTAQQMTIKPEQKLTLKRSVRKSTRKMGGCTIIVDQVP